MAGGRHTRQYHQDTEIFDLKTQTWSQGEPLPFGLLAMQNSFQYDRDTIIVANYKEVTSKIPSSGVLEYSTKTHAWKPWDGANLSLSARLPKIFLLDIDLST